MGQETAAQNATRGGVSKSEREYETLHGALNSIRTEGFCVIEQMEKDCIRLVSGEVSVVNLTKIFPCSAKAV